MKRKNPIYDFLHDELKLDVNFQLHRHNSKQSFLYGRSRRSYVLTSNSFLWDLNFLKIDA